MDNLKKTIQRKLEPLSIISNALNNDLSVPELKKENKVENYLNLKHNEYDYQNKLLYLLIIILIKIKTYYMTKRTI